MIGNAYVVFLDSNPSNVVAIFFSGIGGQQNPQAAAVAWRDAMFPTASVEQCTDADYVRLTQTPIAIQP